LPVAARDRFNESEKGYAIKRRAQQVFTVGQIVGAGVLAWFLAGVLGAAICDPAFAPRHREDVIFDR